MELRFILDRVEINVLRAFLLGVIYGKIEQSFVVASNSSSAEYRFLYIGLLILPFLNKDIRLWVADGLFAMFTQDISYWIYAQTLPFQWAWYYPVIDHVPLDDIFAIPAFILLYVWAWKQRLISTKT